MWFVVVLLLVAPGAARAGSLRPTLVAGAGGTFLVSGPEPNDGGASVTLAALWPVEHGLSFGLEATGADAGTQVDSLRVAGAGLPYGKVEQLHRAIWGIGWRADLALPRLRWGGGAKPGPWRAWLPFAQGPYATGSFGLYRVADDLRGTSIRRASAAGYSLGLGWRYGGANLALGPVLRYTRIYDDRTGRFLSAGLEGSWR